jgi:hypothetical protein
LSSSLTCSRFFSYIFFLKTILAGLEEEAASCYEATLELFADLQQGLKLY